MKITERIDKYLSEYFTRPGDSIYDAWAQTNAYIDLVSPDSAFDKRPEDKDIANTKTFKKYKSIAAAFDKIIKNKKGKISQSNSNKIDNLIYDGSDAYDTPADYDEYMPKIYDKQIDFFKNIIGE